LCSHEIGDFILLKCDDVQFNRLVLEYCIFGVLHLWSTASLEYCIFGVLHLWSTAFAKETVGYISVSQPPGRGPLPGSERFSWNLSFYFSKHFS
jgi:hypothetical protein